MKIVYFHGFASSGASGTVQLLRQLMPEAEVIAPDIPVEPLEALPFLRQLVEQEQPDVIIGTSMGGMYAHQMHGFKRICVNPAVNMSTMSHVLKTGEHKFLNGRKDNQKTFRITRDIIQHHNQIERQQFKNLTDEDRADVWGLFGIHDKTNRVTIKMVDKDTKKVIKEFPPEETLDMIAKVWEIAGIMVDEKR
jgi:predicted esterase YcpF (UPF0227 family)